MAEENNQSFKVGEAIAEIRDQVNAQEEAIRLCYAQIGKSQEVMIAASREIFMAVRDQVSELNSKLDDATEDLAKTINLQAIAPIAAINAVLPLVSDLDNLNRQYIRGICTMAAAKVGDEVAKKLESDMTNIMENRR